MTTLFDLTLQLSELVQRTVGGTADSGSTTTLVDGDRTERANYFDNGTIWFESGANDGVSAQVTGWAQSTGTFTFGAVTAVAADVQYSAGPADFPRWLLQKGISWALRDIGMLPLLNEGLSVTADTEAYALPSGVGNVKRVAVATNDSEPYGWQVYQDWDEVDGYLRFANPPTTAGRVIRVWYEAVHAAVSADIDTVNDALADELVVWCAVVAVLRWKKQQYQGDMSELYVDLLNEALVNRERLIGEYGVKRVVRGARTSGY